MLEIRLFLGGAADTWVAFIPYDGRQSPNSSSAYYPFLESITHFRESVSSGSAQQPRGADGRFTSGGGDVGAAETPTVTIGLYNRQNELWNLVGLLRRTPVQVVLDDEIMFTGLVTKQTLGATMTLEATS